MFCNLGELIRLFEYENLKTESSGWESNFLGPYFALVPGLCLLSATGRDLLVLSFDLGYDLLHVQAATVVHLHHHRGVFDAGLQLTQLLVKETKQRRYVTQKIFNTTTLVISERTTSSNIIITQFFCFNKLNIKIFSSSKNEMSRHVRVKLQMFELFFLFF